MEEWRVRTQELSIEASVDKLPLVLQFVDSHLEEAGCSMREQMKIDLSVEEIFVNIANYAYTPGKGMAVIRLETSQDRAQLTITFTDHGIPYNPLEKEDPDVTVPIRDRNIGGLGIFLTKKNMDKVAYEYKDGSNILRLTKNLRN